MWERASMPLTIFCSNKGAGSAACDSIITHIQLLSVTTRVTIHFMMFLTLNILVMISKPKIREGPVKAQIK